MSGNNFGCKVKFETGEGKAFLYSLENLEKNGIGSIDRLPFSIRILLEQVLRNLDGKQVLQEDVIESQGQVDCTITVVGELDPSKTFLHEGKVFRVPPEWQGVYNVKWQIHTKINPNEETNPNTYPIIFKRS